MDSSLKQDLMIFCEDSTSNSDICLIPYELYRFDRQLIQSLFVGVNLLFSTSRCLNKTFEDHWIALKVSILHSKMPQDFPDPLLKNLY